jgi:hypothetical protein
MSTTTIDTDQNVTTLINVFTVNPETQQTLVDLLIEATEQVMRHHTGFVSANIHTRSRGPLRWAAVEAGKWALASRCRSSRDLRFTVFSGQEPGPHCAGPPWRWENWAALVRDADRTVMPWSSWNQDGVGATDRNCRLLP